MSAVMQIAWRRGLVFHEEPEFARFRAFRLHGCGTAIA
jgi:hypothetical protein